MAPTADLLPGTLDMLILKAVSLGPLHGYGVLLRIEQITGQALTIEQGSLYPALHRLEHRGLLETEWGRSENNRRAKFYRLTAAGRKRLDEEPSRLATVCGRRRRCAPREAGGDLAMWKRRPGSNELNDEIDRELEHHLELRARDLTRRGLDADEARRQARLELGARPAKTEECREARGLFWLDEARRHTAFALRQLRRNPAFAISAILTLGLCIGVNTAIFSAGRRFAPAAPALS